MSATATWSISVFQVSGIGVQQRILRAIRHIDRPGVVALSAKAANHYYVTLDSERLADELHAQRVVTVLDRHAVRTYSSRGTHRDALVSTTTPLGDASRSNRAVSQASF